MTESPPIIGKDRFEIGQLLGAGAFGEVFRAFDREQDLHVALKVLRNVNPRALSLFKQEFRSLAKVVHPNLIQFYELFAEENQWFFTMELLEGIDLLEYIRGAPEQDLEGAQAAQSTIQQSVSQFLHSKDVQTSLDPEMPTIIEPKGAPIDPAKTAMTEDWQYQGVVLPDTDSSPDLCVPEALTPRLLDSPEAYERLKQCFGQLAVGVTALHEAQKLHRDLKPSNTLVVDEGRVVLLDFGLVKDLDSDLEGDESETEIVGTPRYMSPEQAKDQDVGEASDWYSVGVMLYEALVGLAPFRGSAKSILRNKLRKDPPAPIELDARIPKLYNDLCMGLLHRDPKERFQGKEVLTALGFETSETLSGAPEFEARSSGATLVGREEHLAFLHQSFEKTRLGRSVGVYVHGHSGMGKSYLVQHFLTEVAEKHNALVLGGSCYQRESIPYKGWDDGMTAIAGILSRLPYKESLDYVPEDIGAVVQLFPVFRQVEAIAELVATPLKIKDPKEIRRRAYRGVKELLFRFSKKHAVVWAVEDLQWGDFDSASLFGEVLKASSHIAMLYLGTYRTDEVKNNPTLKQALKALPFPELEVGGLEEEDVGVFAQELMGDQFDPSLDIGELTRESGGSPYFISELLRYALNASQSHISRRLERVQLDDMIRDRVAQLLPQAREFLEVLAVAGRPLILRSVESCLGKETIEARTLALLKKENFVLVSNASGGTWVECFHDRIRESVFHGLSSELRMDYHKRLAQVLSSEDDMDAGSVAFHFKESGDIEKATAYALKAANHAYETLAFAKAVQLYIVALQTGILSGEDERGSRIKLGEALTNLGQGRQAAVEFLAAAELSTPSQALDLQQRAAHQFFTTGYLEDGVTTMRGVLAKVGMTLPDYSSADFLPMIGRDLKLRWRGFQFKEITEDQAEREALIRIDSCWSVVAALATVDVVASMDFCMRMVLFALEVGEPYRIARAFAAQAYMDVNVGRFRRRAQLRRGHKFLGKATAIAERLNQPYLLGFVSKGPVPILKVIFAEARS
ncbi:MAG: protein kinase [Planctomycetota bacterium]|nr:protein kinase [Planctomycetota bacterium]